jgi:hypothetical protein
MSAEYRDYVKIKVLLPKDERNPNRDVYESELLWARPVDAAAYVLDNIPFYAYGLSCEDVVAASATNESHLLNFECVLRQGGHSTYRAIVSESLSEQKAADYEHLYHGLLDLGCRIERADSRLFAVDVPPQANIYAAYDVLLLGQEEGIWDFEEANYEAVTRT